MAHQRAIWESVSSGQRVSHGPAQRLRPERLRQKRRIGRNLLDRVRFAIAGNEQDLLFGLVGKLSAVVGPLMYGGIVLILQPRLGTLAYQVAILSLLVLMVIGVAILRRVPQPPPSELEA